MGLRSEKSKILKGKLKMIILAGMLVIIFLMLISSAIYFIEKYKREEFQRLINQYNQYYGIDTSKRWQVLSEQTKQIEYIKSQLNIGYPLNKGKMTSLWGMRHSPLTPNIGGDPNDFHEGIDISANQGEPVHAVESGYVEYAKELYGTGLTVRIYHGWISTIYGHLSKLKCDPKTWVGKDQIIGLVGNTGRYSTGNHLHFAIYNNTLSNYQNPILYLPSAE